MPNREAPFIHATNVEAEQEHLTRHELLNMIPGLTEVGQTNPLEAPKTTDFPEVMYHAHPGENFQIDDFFKTGDKQGVGRSLLGEGLYACGPELAGLYQDKLSRKGPAGVAELRPYKAHIIDLESSEASKSLSHAFLKAAWHNTTIRVPQSDDPQSYHEAYHKLRSASIQDPTQPVSELAMTNLGMSMSKEGQAALKALGKRYNLKLILNNGLNGQVALKIRDLLPAGQARSPYPQAKIDVESVQAFLMDLGVDGIMQTIFPSVASNTPYLVAALWRQDHVGDKATWERRLPKQAKLKSIAQHAGRLAKVAEEPKNSGEYPAVPSHAEGLIREKHLSRSAAEALWSKAHHGKLLDEEQGKWLQHILFRKHVNPFSLVKDLAYTSPDLSRLLSAEVGVWEGYRLHEHTQAALGQFERFYQPLLEDTPSERSLAGLARTILLLQDMGKPLAHALEGKRYQAGYNRQVAANILESMPLPKVTRHLISDVISQDIIGEAIKGGVEATETAARQLAELAVKHRRTIGDNELFQLMYMVYECDATAYTSYAQYHDAKTGQLITAKAGGPQDAFRISVRSGRIKLTEANEAKLDMLQDRTNAILRTVK